MKIFKLFLILSILLLTGCATYHSVNACYLIPKAPKLNDSRRLLEQEPDLANWIIAVKDIRKQNNCK